MKRFTLVLAVLTVASACSSVQDASQATASSGAIVSATTVDDAAANTAGETSDTPAAPDTTVATDTTVEGVAEAPAGREAPDFTMTLVGAAPFTLSEQTKPVYMIFWADW